MTLPVGFRVSGIRSGVKRNKPDTALIVSDRDCVVAARVTTNRARAACCSRTASLVPAGQVRAIIAISGNANALTGNTGILADQRLAAALANQLAIPTDQVLTACTGVVGTPLHVEHVERAMEAAVAALGTDPEPAARAVMTTDRRKKIYSVNLAVPSGDGASGEVVQGTLAIIAKGSGMIHPNLGTTLVFGMTDLPLSKQALSQALTQASLATVEQLTVDGDQSTNDSVIVLANGAASTTPIEAGSAGASAFTDALTAMFRDVAREIARDGEGATRRLTVDVEGAENIHIARHVARSICGSSLVKAAIFGADPSWGRILAAAGQALASLDVPGSPTDWRLQLQGAEVFKHGEPVTFERRDLATRLQDEDVRVWLDLGVGGGRGTAWGCDLSYEYVKINADYAAAVGEDESGAVGLQAQLAVFSPKVKRALLMESLRYIERFRGRRLVIKVSGNLIEDADSCTKVAEDLVLLRSIGMRPVVVNGGSEAIDRALAARGRVSNFVDGHRVTPPEDADLVEMVLLGQVNRKLTSRINAVGGKGVGLSGADAGVLRATPLEASDGTMGTLGAMGRVAAVDTELIDSLTEKGYIPVIAPVGVGADGTTWNLDAEDAAGAVAAAFKAFKLVYLLADIGVRADGERVSRLKPRHARRLLREGAVTGTLVHVIEASLNALGDGVERVHLVDGRVEHNLISELFTDAGAGTLLTLEDETG